MDYKKMMHEIRKQKEIKFSDMARDIGVSVNTFREWREDGIVRELSRLKIEKYLEKMWRSMQEE